MFYKVKSICKPVSPDIFKYRFNLRTRKLIRKLIVTKFSYVYSGIHQVQTYEGSVF